MVKKKTRKKLDRQTNKKKNNIGSKFQTLSLILLVISKFLLIIYDYKCRKKSTIIHDICCQSTSQPNTPGLRGSFFPLPSNGKNGNDDVHFVVSIRSHTHTMATLQGLGIIKLQCFIIIACIKVYRHREEMAIDCARE